MFIQINKFGKNSLKDMLVGVYESNAHVYHDTVLKETLYLIEYCLEGTTLCLAVDVLIKNNNGKVFFSDFIKMKDFSWRNTYGERNDDLFNMLPDRFRKMKFVESKKLPTVEVTNEQ